MTEFSFVELREIAEEVATLGKQVADLSKKIDTTVAGDVSPVVGQQVAGAMSLVEQKLAAFNQRLTQADEQLTQKLLEMRAAIPAMPDFGPLVAALQSVTARLDEQAARVPGEPPGLAALTKAIADLVKGQRELHARLARPVVREGIAELPSGAVKLRISETRTEN